MGKGSLLKNNLRPHLEYLRGGRGAHQTIWDDSGKTKDDVVRNIFWKIYLHPSILNITWILGGM